MDKVIKMYREAILSYIRFDREKAEECFDEGLIDNYKNWSTRASAYETALEELDNCIKIYAKEETK